MNRNSIFITLSMLFYAPFCFGIKWESCWKEVKTWEFLGISSSTTSYVSSIGDCAMLAKNDEEKQKLFLSNNFESIKNDIARGEGEHLRVLTGLFLIENGKIDSFKIELQQNYLRIFNYEKIDIESVYSELLTIAEHQRG